MPKGGSILAFECIKVAQSIEHFRLPPVLMLLLAMGFRKRRKVTAPLCFKKQPDGRRSEACSSHLS